MLIARTGEARAFSITRVTAANLRRALKENVSPDATLMTDELRNYKNTGLRFGGGHETVCHGRREYLRGDVHVNSAESFFALLKRGVHGTFHHVSKQHLHRYCTEFAFRWSYRKTMDAERTTAALRRVTGKRLAYRAMKSRPMPGATV